MRIGEKIKFRRKELGISADELANKLNINRSTMFRYEKGDIEKVPVSFLKDVAVALNVSPAYLMGWSDSKDDINTIYNKLNQSNKNKTYNYANKLLKQQERKIHSIYSIYEEEKTYNVNILGAVSAGTGEWLNEEQQEEVVVNEEPPVYDFAVRVNGVSMVPTFADGQIIYVKRIYSNDEVRDNQFVIAELNGESYVKKIVFGKGRSSCRLVSLNKDYQDIIVTNDDDFRVVGVVVI